MTNPDSTVREAEGTASSTVRENGQNTVRDSGASGSAFSELRTFRDYRVVRQLPTSGSESDVYVVEKGQDTYILKLYRYKIDPKVEVINNIVNLSRAHPHELIRVFEFGFDETTRRWFEIQEYARHGSLKKLMAESLPRMDERGL